MSSSFFLGLIILIAAAAIVAVIGRQGDKIADSIEAGRGVDTLYVADSLVYKLTIELPDSLCEDYEGLLRILADNFHAVRIVPRGIREESSHFGQQIAEPKRKE